MARPDLKVFVSTGDGDCLSIGAAHWIHAIRYNMDLTVLLHDNRIYGLTKKQASPTSPIGTKSNTTPKGSYLEALNPLTVTLGVANVSFVAQVVDWIPELLYQVISAAYRHKGLSFIRVIQRCPAFMPGLFDPWMQDPQRPMRSAQSGRSLCFDGLREGRRPVYVTYGEPMRAEDGETVAQFSERITKEVSGLIDYATTYRANQA